MAAGIIGFTDLTHEGLNLWGFTAEDAYPQKDTALARAREILAQGGAFEIRIKDEGAPPKGPRLRWTIYTKGKAGGR